MIILDENIIEDQCQLLRSWRIRFRQIGQDVGRQGMKDEEHVLPLLRESARPTFFTRDLGFFDKKWCHKDYAVMCLAVSQNEVARFVRRLLRHPAFNTKASRLGAVVRVGPVDLRVWRLHSQQEEVVEWT